MKKYKLLKEDSIKVDNRTLYRIEAVRDFGNVKKGDIGGYIEKEGNLSHEGDCWVYDVAQVFGNAAVFGKARLHGMAQVFGKAQVFGVARVCDNAHVFDKARVRGDARVFGWAQVCDNVHVYGGAMVGGVARVYDGAQVYGMAQVYGKAQVRDSARVFGWARVWGDARVYGDAECSSNVKNITGLRWNITITDKHVRVGCIQVLKEDIKKLKHTGVLKKQCTLEEFSYYKNLILPLIQGFKHNKLKKDRK